MTPKTFQDLKAEVATLRKAKPMYSPDNAFVHWFLKAFLSDDDQVIDSAVIGGAGDIGVDAVLVDDDSQRAYVVQAKYHLSETSPLTASDQDPSSRTPRVGHPWQQEGLRCQACEGQRHRQ